MEQQTLPLSAECTVPGATTFFGPSVFRKVLDRFDIGQGDRFYDDPRAYDVSWGEALRTVQSSLVVTFATRGELGTVRYVIERRDPQTGDWQRGAEHSTTQRDFASLVRLLP